MLGELLLAVMLAAVPQNELDSGRQALESGDFTHAEQFFRQYLSEHPTSAEALSNLGALCARREQYPQAVTFYEKALRADPKLMPVHFNMAVALGQLNEYSKAADHLRAFLKAYPNNARGRQLLGLCLMESGDMKGALVQREASYKDNPKDASILYALAFTNARAGDVNRAADLLRKSESNPAQAKLIEGLIEYRRGRFAEAKTLFAEVLRLSPSNGAALTALGRLELLDHNDAEAIRLLEHALQLNPSDAESTYQLGVLYDRNGRSDEAVKLLRRAITLRGNYADPYYQLGRIAFDKGNYRTALAQLETACHILPDQEAIRLLLGRTYQALGRDTDAKAEFAEVRLVKGCGN